MVKTAQHLLYPWVGVAIGPPMVKTAQHLNWTGVIMTPQLGEILHSLIVAIVHTCSCPVVVPAAFAPASASAPTPAAPGAPALATSSTSPEGVSATTLHRSFLAF